MSAVNNYEKNKNSDENMFIGKTRSGSSQHNS